MLLFLHKNIMRKIIYIAILVAFTVISSIYVGQYVSLPKVSLKKGAVFYYKMVKVPLSTRVCIFDNVFKYAEYLSKMENTTVYIIIKYRNGSKKVIKYIPLSGKSLHTARIHIKGEDLTSHHVKFRYGVEYAKGEVLKGTLIVKVLDVNGSKIKVFASINATLLYSEFVEGVRKEKTKRMYREGVYYIDLSTMKAFKENGKELGYTFLILNPLLFTKDKISIDDNKVSLVIDRLFVDPYDTPAGRIRCVRVRMYVVNSTLNIYVSGKPEVGSFIYSKDTGVLVLARRGVMPDAILGDLLDTNLVGNFFTSVSHRGAIGFWLEKFENIELSELALSTHEYLAAVTIVFAALIFLTGGRKSRATY